jgi:transcriptional regulator GlxA family with amidase domain
MDRRVEATIELMKTNGRLYFSTSEMARIVGLSPCHFARLFKTETSKSPTRFLKEVRMQKAEEMFTKTALNLKEVVYAVGQSDRCHFSREFERLHGLTPKEFVSQRRCYSEDRVWAVPRVANPATEHQLSPHF